MKAVAILLPALLVWPLSLAPQDPPTAFVGVDVLPMDRERILEGHTVVVQDGLIQEVAPSHRVRLPDDARVIEGEGLYLMPGLADMHLTLPYTPPASQETKDFLFLLLANNITVVRGMEGAPRHLQLKREIAAGALQGPTVFPGAPPMGGEDADDPEEAVRLMLAHRRTGYDFQPIEGDMPPEVWDSLTEEAHSRGYTFGGTIPPSVGLRAALSSGISTIEHMDGFLPELVGDPVRARLDRGESVPLRQQLGAVEGRKMRAIAAHTRSSDSWIVPTLHEWENRYRSLDVDSVLALPEMELVPARTVEGWILEAGSAPPVPPETAELLIEVRRRLLRAISMAGVGVLMGTDCPGLFLVPGFSLRDELRSMASAGLTPYEILVTGTRNVAEYARNELLEPGNFGTVEEGNRADLILLRANPFLSLDALWDQEGVMVRGRWMPREEIQEGLASIRERLGG